MTRVLGLTTLFVALAVLCVPAEAQYCATRGRTVVTNYHHQAYYPTYSAHAYQYHAPTVATILQFTPPSYYVGYTPSGGEAQLQIDLLKLKNELLQLRLEQAQTQGKQPGLLGQAKKEAAMQPQQAPQPEQAPQQINTTTGGRLKVFTAKCASCHDAGVADKKGGGLILTAGNQLAPLSYDDANLLTRVLYTGKTSAGKSMPPSGPLGDEEAGLCLIDPSPKK